MNSLYSLVDKQVLSDDNDLLYSGRGSRAVKGTRL